MPNWESLAAWNWDQIPVSQWNLGLGSTLLISLLYCFLGYRIFRTILALSGFILAGAVAAFGAGFISQGHPIAMGLTGLIGGCCGALALHFLYRVGVFILGVLGGYVSAAVLLEPFEASWYIWALLGAMLLGGLLALWLEKPVMRFATAALGAWGIVYTLFAWLLQSSLKDPLQNAAYEPYVNGGGIAAIVFLCVLGFFFQGKGSKKTKVKG